jgi:uncharacterized membrane protein
MAIDLASFWAQNFSTPLCHYYTPIGTLAYGLILVAAVAGTWQLLKKLKIDIDKRFFYALIPFIIYGGLTRALRDHSLGIYTSNAWWWCSPPIYFIIFAITLGSLLIGIFAQKRWKVDYWKVTAGIGALLLAYDIAITAMAGLPNLLGFGMIAGLVTGWAALLLMVRRAWPASRKVLTRENTGIMIAHLLDASSTFTALTFFGFYEQHVVPSFLINMFGPAVMFPLKLIVVLPVLWYIDRNEDSKQFRGFLKIVVLILGLALGIRDWLTVGLTVV